MFYFVEAYVASWIEIIRYDDIFIISCRGLCGLVDWNRPHPLCQTPAKVEAYVASWIEILYSSDKDGWTASRLMWPRGLKWDNHLQWLHYKRRGLYGLVDWNPSSQASAIGSAVEAYTASWIEILTFAHRRSTPPVEAYTASWIEIIAVSYMTTGSVASRLIRPYGLK